MRTLITTILCGVVFAVAGRPALLFAYTCGPAQLAVHSFSGQGSSYTVTRSCTHSYGGDEYEKFDITYAGMWHGDTEVANEYVTNHVRYYHDGVKKNDQTYHYQVTAKCLQDPWLTGMDCYSHHVDNQYPECGGIVTGPPNPKGAAILPAAIRQSLQQEYYGLRAAPSILAPGQGAGFGFPVDIPLRIQHNPDQDLRFKIEWRPDAQHALQQVATSIITNKQTNNGIMTATLHPIKEGEWTIRAQLDTDAAPWWSDPVTIKVQASILGQPPAADTLETITIPAASSLVAPEFLLPRENHTYSADESIPLQIRFQQGMRLRYQLGVRAKGSTLYTMLPVTDGGAADDGFFATELPGYLGALANGDVAELLIKAWVERQDDGGQQYLANQSPITELVTQIVAPKLTITAPQEAQKIAAPATVHFAIPFTTYGSLFSGVSGAAVENLVEVELQRADKVAGSAIAFAPCTEPVTTRVFGDLLLFSYELADPAIYRFRARLAMSSATGTGGESFQGQWTDWRRIELTSLHSQLQPIATTGNLAVHQMQESVSLKLMSPNKAATNIRPTPESLTEKITPVGPEKSLVRQHLSAKGSGLSHATPMITRPLQGQKLRAGASVPLVIQGLNTDAEILWEIEYRPFGEQRFTRIPPTSLKQSESRTALHQTAHLLTKGDGEYRVRIRLDNQHQPWGQWREFQVGTPPVKQLVRPANRVKPVLTAPTHQTQAIEPAQPEDTTSSIPTQIKKPAVKTQPLPQMRTIKMQ
ncbi:hypothetical protein [Desulfofustis glycolicus]|uniref:Uncharacterized protein n=1 Tax=Desulfofustis glycolicus DSM 9705 TaxID=1121409 RepID=A0A1M5WP91_9BACT|nr:hypothetical protein [Desulfofustis glycolicus]MCB2218730.1 hypothetical protein [Desulfobulbaceae bacterium]SHH89348.1 hypothetical protein SAMN02745124_02422 [Desulfofustis glycolicus DSM 9705]